MSLNVFGRGNEPQRKVYLFISDAIKASGKTPLQIAAAMGYPSDQVKLIETVMEGRSKLPVNKVFSFAQAVGLEPALVFETVMREYSPQTLEAIQQVYGIRVGGA